MSVCDDTNSKTICQCTLFIEQVLSKADTASNYDIDIEEFLYPEDALCKMDDAMNPKYSGLNAKLCEMMSDYSLVHFKVIDIMDAKSMAELMEEIDNANSFKLNNVII